MKKILASAALAVLMLTGGAVATSTPAEARVSVGFYYGDPYYGPHDYHRYSRWAEPVYYNGYWYRDPYWRWEGRRRAYWIDNGWRYDGWRGHRPRHIRWERRHHRDGGHHRGHRRHWRD